MFFTDHYTQLSHYASQKQVLQIFSTFATVDPNRPNPWVTRPMDNSITSYIAPYVESESEALWSDDWTL